MMSDHPQHLPTIQNALHASDMLDAMATITTRINNAALPNVRLDPLTIYCNKTGQPIGQRTNDAIFDAIRFHGKTHFCEIAHRAHGLNSAPAWVSTDSESLDRLLEADPVGYTAYSLGVICDKFTNKPVRYDANAIAAHHYALARAWAIIHHAHASDTTALVIVELNYKIMELLNYGENLVKQIVAKLGDKAHMPDTLAHMAISGALEPLIDEAINNTMRAMENHALAMKFPNTGKRFESLARTPADASRGPSNIKGQSRVKTRVKNRMQVLKLMKEFGDLGFGESLDGANRGLSKSTGDLYSRVMAQQERHDPVLDKLAAVDFDKWADMDIGDILADTVEVRTITREQADIHAAADMFPDLVAADDHPATDDASMANEPAPFATLTALVEAQAAKVEIAEIVPEPAAKFGALFATLGKRKGGAK